MNRYMQVIGNDANIVEIIVHWLVLRVSTVSNRWTNSWSVPNMASPMKNALAAPAQNVVGSLRLRLKLNMLRGQAKLAPLQDKIFKYMQKEIEDLDESDRWKLDDEQENQNDEKDDPQG